MRAIKSKNTKSEVLLAKALWHKGYRYRKHDKSIYGTPDLSFKKYKIAIFVDSEFFHGKDWETLKLRLNSNTEFWCNKIERNIAKDNSVNETLAKKGWVVLRFWSGDIAAKVYKAVKTIEQKIIEFKGLVEYKEL